MSVPSVDSAAARTVRVKDPNRRLAWAAGIPQTAIDDRLLNQPGSDRLALPVLAREVGHDLVWSSPGRVSSSQRPTPCRGRTAETVPAQ